MVLTEEKIEVLNSAIEDANARQERLKLEHNEKRENIASLQAEIKNNEQLNEKLQKQVFTLQSELRDIASEYNPLNKVITDAENELSEDAWEKSVLNLVSKQEDFFVMAERQLTKIQEELKETLGDFVDFIDPATAIKNIKAAIEGSGFGRNLATLRAGETGYNQAIRDLCERKLQGRPIEISAASVPVDRLKQWLRHEDVMAFWKK